MAMAIANQSRSLARLLRPSQMTQARGLSSDHGHVSSKVNCWQDPLSPSKWKEEHFVLVSVAGWGLFGYGIFSFFSGSKKGNVQNEAAHH